MKIYVKDICGFLKKSEISFSYKGDMEFYIIGFAPLKDLKEYSITWTRTADSEVVKKLKGYKNIFLVAPDELKNFQDLAVNILYSQNPKAVFSVILNEFFKEKEEMNISEDATVLSSGIGRNVSIGKCCYIHKDVKIGNNVVIGNNVCIECPATIGDDTIIHSGVVIGTDGFGYYKENGVYHKVPHFGGVFIGERVEIGANTCIDRGTMEDTYIGNDVKIDNLCHIAHNVSIGDGGMVIALSLLGGSSVLEEDVYVAPGAVLMDHVTIGKDSLVGMGAVVTKNVAENKVVAGIPAKVIRDNLG
ncbi:UDP-3-O-(3-hydroxymyristoyl)glucosamine N-acyltransferase [Lachnospiraceae bacterium]|nr:UDP-3-O-(3-hydroxymyristoyl)glucosamine N-acyltransferase [Lachnospiraceae bacterium]